MIRFLLDHDVLMPTHIKPSRSRNQLVNMDALQAQNLDPIAQPSVAVLEKISKSLAPSDATRVKIPQLIQEQEEFTFFFAHEVQLEEAPC